MVGKAFAPWVEPIAAQLRESRAQIAEVARSFPADAWERPSPTEGWTYKDILAHLAVGDWLCQTVLRAAISKEPLNRDLFADINSQNERYRLERVGRSVDDLIAEVEAEGEDTQSLLARLTEAHEATRLGARPKGLVQYLRHFPRHDRQHLDDLRAALGE